MLRCEPILVQQQTMAAKEKEERAGKFKARQKLKVSSKRRDQQILDEELNAVVGFQKEIDGRRRSVEESADAVKMVGMREQGAFDKDKNENRSRGKSTDQLST